MLSHPRQIAAALIAFFLVGQSMASTSSDDPLKGLPSAVADQLRKHLPGVVMGRAEDLPPLKEARDWLPLSQVDFVFERTGDGDRTTRWTITPAKKVPGLDKSIQGWTLVQSNGTTRFLSLDKDGVIQSQFTVNHPNGLLIKLDPPEPVVHPVGSDVPPEDIRISVSDLGSPDDVEYSGTARCTWRDLGGFRVKVPAGDFKARLLRVHYKGSVGPASVDGSRLLFVAPGTGPVAFSDDRDISAFLFFNDDTAHAGVLRKVSRGD
jgi:hypothetical protein